MYQRVHPPNRHHKEQDNGTYHSDGIRGGRPDGWWGGPCRPDGCRVGIPTTRGWKHKGPKVTTIQHLIINIVVVVVFINVIGRFRRMAPVIFAIVQELVIVVIDEEWIRSRLVMLLLGLTPLDGR